MDLTNSLSNKVKPSDDGSRALGADMRADWEKPTMQRLKAGEAEAGINPGPEVAVLLS